MLSGDGEEDDDADISDSALAKKLDKLLKINIKQEEIKLEDEIDLKLYRLEQLLKKRPLLLNSCLLRQNKYNVQEWLNRIKLVYVIASYILNRRLMNGWSLRLSMKLSKPLIP
jgi:pre-mRNA-splicing factor SYF1